MRFLFVLLLIISLELPLFGHESETARDEGDTSRVTFIDPCQEDAGDFLDFDLREHANKAYRAYQEGKFEESARWYLILLRHNIDDGGSIYNLACCYGLLGQEYLAAKYLIRSAKAGFDDVEHVMRDPDFDEVRNTEVFRDAVEHLRKITRDRQNDLGELIQVEAQSFFPCRIHLPGEFDSTKTYPLLVGLHGYGSDPDGFITLWKRFEKNDFIYACPQAPYPFSAGNNIGYSWMARTPAVGDSLSMLTAESYILRVIDDVKKRYNVHQVYLFGFSQGCSVAYFTGIRNHGLFAGLIGFGGWLDTDRLDDEMIGKGRGVRVFIAHGNSDRTVKPESGAEARDRLRTAGYEVTFHEFDGAHSVPEDALKEAEKWMKSYAGTAKR
jgi:phospholipase/carboxylesterase